MKPFARFALAALALLLGLALPFAVDRALAFSDCPTRRLTLTAATEDGDTAFDATADGWSASGSLYLLDDRDMHLLMVREDGGVKLAWRSAPTADTAR
ncbi:MAG: hypothetical protein ABIO70_00175 [Pseudomonadota bacterium]